MGTYTNNKPKYIKKRQSKNLTQAEKYFITAENLRLENKYKESVENYLNSILINRNNFTSYTGIAMSYKNLKNYNKAILNLSKAAKLRPFDAFVQKELAICNIIQGDFETGIKHLITSIKLEPANIDIQMQLALVHELIEEENMALMIYQKIIDTNPEYCRAYIQKATLYLHIGDYLNSAKVFKQIIKLKPDYYRAYLAIGICYEKLENITGAKRFYKKYLELCQECRNYDVIVKRISELNTNKKKIHNLKII